MQLASYQIQYYDSIVPKAPAIGSHVAHQRVTQPIDKLSFEKEALYAALQYNTKLKQLAMYR